MDDIRDKIGRKIAALRSENNMSQQQLADAAGVERTHLSRIEQGRFSARLDVLERIANVFGKHIDFV